MYKILVALLPFIKELFFDKEEEMDFSSSKFNIKKWMIYFLFILGCIYALLVTNSLFNLSTKLIELNKNYHKLEAIEKNENALLNSTIKKNEEIQEELNNVKKKCLLPDPEEPKQNDKLRSNKVKKSEPNK